MVAKGAPWLPRPLLARPQQRAAFLHLWTASLARLTGLNVSEAFPFREDKRHGFNAGRSHDLSWRIRVRCNLWRGMKSVRSCLMTYELDMMTMLVHAWSVVQAICCCL